MNDIVEKIILLYEEKGGSTYGGEAVTQAQHALQGALFAKNANSSSAQITAVLLHDIGHLLHDLPDDAPENGVDDVHEELAATFLRTHFIDEVTEPVRLHVAAKRYLASKKEGYYDLLSEPSKISLELQGGPMSDSECIEFEQNPYFQKSVELRLWDDMAKDPNIVTPEIRAFASDIEASLR